MVDAKFQVYKDVAGKYRFRLVAPNNRIVAVGEAYNSKAGCLKGVNAVKRYCAANVEDLTIREENNPVPKFQVFKDRNEEYRFHLLAPNYEVVAASEGYESKNGCLNGIEAVKKYCQAEVEDLTVKSVSEIEEITLTLNQPPTPVAAGSKIKFTGKLLQGRAGVANQTIEIYESDRSFMQDDFIASGETGRDGSYNINWEAEKMDWWDDTVEVYARWKEPGSRRLIPIHSETYVIKIT
jgi:uncharacterized protein YegP (UPF0339 family)